MIKKKAKRIIAIFLTLFMLLPLLSACSGLFGTAASGTILVQSIDFNFIFNPILYHTAYDADICNLTNISIYNVDRNANLIDGACTYKAPEQFTGDDGETYVKYTYKLRSGLKFTDGKDVTADDIIFSYKLYFDPTYDGLANLYSLNILGINEYRYDDPDYNKDPAAKQAEYDALEETYYKQAEESITEDYIIKWVMNEYGVSEEDAKGYDDGDKADAIDAYTQELLSKYWSDKLASGEQVTEVEGIKKIDNKTVEVTIKGVQATDELDLAIPIIPKHYYGENYKKGDLSTVKAFNEKPLGAGAYIYDGFADNVVTLKANKDYYEGAPKLETLKFVVVAQGNEYEALTSDEVDISFPSANPDRVTQCETDGYEYRLLDNNGYGYIGINADRVPDKNVRKALMSLMNRAPAVEAYYGNLATIIERPLSKISWAYPEGATEYYGYSLDKSLEYFKAAGYEQVDGKLVKDGQQFSVDLWISSATHPVVPLFTQMKIDLENLGAICNFHDTDWSVYNEKYQQGLVDVWAAAWGGSADPDMYQNYHSSQSGGSNNPYHIKNSELDALIMEGRQTLDKDKRKEIYKKAYDIVMDEAVEMPFYQRMNMYAINQNRFDVTSLPTDMTPYYGWYAEVWNLKAVDVAEAE